MDRLGAGGSTAGGKGIVLVYRVAEEHYLKGGINRILLGTDGDFNVGITREVELTRLIEQERQGGVYLTVLGFGMRHLKDSTLEKLAHHGNGHYAYLGDRIEARKIYYDTIKTLARGAIRADPGGHRAGFLELVNAAETLAANK